MTYKWPPGFPTNKTRVAMDCGSRGQQFSGTVINNEGAGEVVIVQWDKAIPTAESAVPVSHLVPLLETP